MKIKNIFSRTTRGPVSVALAVVLSVLFVTSLVNAATTISTNISTAGTLTVTGAVNASSTLATSGNITVAAAYGLDTAGGGALNLGTTTATSVIIGSTNAKVGIASSSPYVALGVTGTTTASLGMVIGGNGSGITQLEFGSCTPTIGSIAASTTLSAICTGSEAVDGTGWRVFVTPNITEGRDIIFSSASSTASGIQITLANINATGVVGTINPTDNTWSWMAVK